VRKGVFVKMRGCPFQCWLFIFHQVTALLRFPLYARLSPSSQSWSHSFVPILSPSLILYLLSLSSVWAEIGKQFIILWETACDKS
jgi:hypothetical protein